MSLLAVHDPSLLRVGLLLPWALGAVIVAALAEIVVARATRPEPPHETGRRSVTDAAVRRLDPDDDGRLDHLAYSMVAARRLQGGDHVLCVAGDCIPADGTVVSGVAFTDVGPLSPGAAAPGGASIRGGYVVVRRSRSASAGTSTSNAAAPNGTRVTSAERRRSQPPAPASPVRRASSST